MALLFLKQQQYNTKIIIVAIMIEEE